MITAVASKALLRNSIVSTADGCTTLCNKRRSLHSNDSARRSRNMPNHDLKAKNSRAVAKAPRKTVHKNNHTSGQSTRLSPIKTVRVLIGSVRKKQQHQWVLHADKGFFVSSSIDKKKKLIKNKDVTIAIKNSRMYCNDRIVNSKRLILQSVHGTILFQNKNYGGTFELIEDKNSYFLINCIDLEEYTYAVLRSESWPGWPLEVNKVLAIASRSYVIAMIVRAQKRNKAYHIKDTNEHQRYNLYGIHTDDKVRRAVKETEGMFLVYNNLPVLAMFDSCCGGVIPAHIADFDFSQAPYLAREYPCTFCKSLRIYSWTKSYERDVFDALLVADIKNVSGYHQIKVHKKDKAGLVQEIMLTSPSASTIISGKKLYALSKDVKSFCFAITMQGSQITIHGSGFGHHIGMCQWGARQMVSQGWDYKSILQFYYPCTTLSKLVR